ncbi:MAG: hypothetical protein ACHQET_13680 [Chitinophagales bacterium]
MAIKFSSRGVITPLLFFIVMDSCAQTDSGSSITSKKLSAEDILEIMYSDHHFAIGGYLTFCQKAMISKSEGKYDMSSSAQLGFEVRLKYYYRIDSKWSLTSGVYAGACGRNYLLTIPGGDIDSSQKEDYIDNGAATRDKNLFYITVPIELQKRWWATKPDKCFFADIGLGINWSPSESDHFTEQLIIPGREPIQILEMNISLNNGGKPWLSFLSGLGYEWILSNKNMISANLNLSLSFAKVANGTYQITVPGQPVTLGNYSVTTSHIGLGINYVFTGARTRLKEINQ